MINYDEFIEVHKPKKQFGSYSDQEMAELAKDLPAEVVEFLTREGISSYANNFLWTTTPGLFHDVLPQWGIKAENCSVFMRTAFGACIYFNKRTKKYYFLDPILGRLGDLADDFDDLVNMMLLLDTVLINGFFINYFQDHVKDPQLIQQEEIFALTPAIPLGGSFETSGFEVVKMREHLAFLAQLFGNKAKKI